MFISPISAYSAYRTNSTQKFGSLKQTTPPELKQFEAIIPDILSYNQSFFQKTSGKDNQNPGFYIDVKNSSDNRKLNYEVYIDSLKKPAVQIAKSKYALNLPQAKFKTGKFGPTIELIDKEIGIKVQLLSDSRTKIGGKLDIYIPEVNGKTKNNVSPLTFGSSLYPRQGGGELQIVTMHEEQAAKEAVDKYLNDKLYNQILVGDYKDELLKRKPNIMILAGGYGTRLYNMTGEHSNKPALKLPTKDSYRLMANALDLVAKSGLIDDTTKTSKGNLVYISGKGTIEGKNVRNSIQDVNLGDGGCIAQALALNKTATDAPLIILNADTFTNADITKAYNEFLKRPDAAILIPYYEASEERASGFGLMAINPDSGKDGVYEITKFVEKPKKPKQDAKEALVAGTDNKYMANPGIYIISPKILKILKSKGEGINSELGLAKGFITPLVKACQEGPLKETGEFMKCYTTKLERKNGGAAYWDDLGLDVAVPETFRNMARETRRVPATARENMYYGMPAFLLNDAVKNTDSDTDIVYMDDKARSKFEQFKAKYKDFSTKGNVVVYNI